MSIGLVDWNGLGMPLLNWIFGPLPLISTNESERTAQETWAVNEARYQAQKVVDNPTEGGILGRHGQYGGMRMLWQMYYATQQIYPELLQAGNLVLEMHRDGLNGFDPNWFDVNHMIAYINGGPNTFVINPFNNPNGEGFAAFSIINPALEAAAVRKTRDIVQYYGAQCWYFLGLRNYDGGEGAREGGVTTRWLFCDYLLRGPSATTSMFYDGAPHTHTTTQLLADGLNNAFSKVPPDRPGFAWDFDGGLPGGHNDKLYIGNKNLGGSHSQGLCRLDRYFKAQNTPDARIWTELKKFLDWLDLGVAPMIGQITSNPGSALQTGGTQWVPGVGQYATRNWRGSWRYYYYHNPNAYSLPNANGVHPDTETLLAGHLMSTYAWAYATETDTTARTRYRARVSEAADGSIRWTLDNGGNPPHVIDPRTWTEGMETWLEAHGLLAEADGEGPIEPPVQDMDVVPLDPAVNALITVTIVNGPGQLGDWVTLAPVGSPLTTYLPSWKYLANNSQAFPSSTPTDGVVTIQAPATPGTFEMRFLRNDLFELAPGFTPVLVLVGGGGSTFQATITRTGQPEDTYTVTVACSPPEEYRVQWFVNNQPYPTAIAGPLFKGSGQRFFRNPSGRALFLTGSHNWNSISEWGLAPGNPANPPPVFDWSGFLTRLLDEGHTATRLWLLGDFVGSITAARVLFPWARSSTPGSVNGGNKYDLNIFDSTYFSRLRDRVVEATSNGITCIIVFFNGWDSQFGTTKNIWHASENTIIDGDPNGNGLTEETYNLTTQPAGLLNIQKAYIHKVVDTLNDIDNIIWEPNNEGGGFSQGWHENIIADLRAYEASKPKQHPIIASYLYSGGTNSQLWNFNVEAVAPGPLAAAGVSPDGSTDYTNNPPASSGAKVVITDTDHIYGVGGNEADVWRNFCRAISTIYMDPLIDQEPFPLPWNSNPPNLQYQRARDAMGLTALMAQRLRTDLNAMLPQAQGTATPCNTGFCMFKAGDIAEVVAYRPAGGPNPVTVDLSSVGSGVTVSYVWEHPFTRVVGGSGTVQGGAVRSFVPPDASDWVLFTRRLDLPYSLFGMTDTTPTQGNLGIGVFTVRADIYEVTGESLLGSRELTIVNAPPNGLIIWPPGGYVFKPASPIHDPQDFLILQPQGPGIDGVQFRIRPAFGGAQVNIGAEVTTPDVNGNFRHDPFVHTVYTDGSYLIDAVVRSGITTSVSPSVSVGINNTGGGVGQRQGRRLRGRLP